jgi:hypothetical protein
MRVRGAAARLRELRPGQTLTLTPTVMTIHTSETLVLLAVFYD